MSRPAEKPWRFVLNAHPLNERSHDAEFWDTYLQENPDVLHRLLADIYRAAYGVDRPPSLDDLWALLDTPEFTSEAFGPAAKALLARRKKSARWLAMQIHVNQRHLGRYLNGTMPIVSAYDVEGSMQRIEAVAKALRIHPSYFCEWRRLWVMRLLDSAFIAHPDLSVDVFRRFSGLEGANARSRSNVS